MIKINPALLKVSGKENASLVPKYKINKKDQRHSHHQFSMQPDTMSTVRNPGSKQ